MKKDIKLLSRYPKELVHKVLYEQDCDIDESFVGFIETYENLAKLIPRTWTVIDFGCAYAPQAWYFRKHKKYIGVDWGDLYRFSVENTEFFVMSIQDWIAKYAQDIPETTFAISNYSLPDTSIVRKTFNYCYTYYPVRDESWPIFTLKK